MVLAELDHASRFEETLAERSPDLHEGDDVVFADDQSFAVFETEIDWLEILTIHLVGEENCNQSALILDCGAAHNTLKLDADHLGIGLRLSLWHILCDGAKPPCHAGRKDRAPAFLDIGFGGCEWNPAVSCTLDFTVDLRFLGGLPFWIFNRYGSHLDFLLIDS